MKIFISYSKVDSVSADIIYNELLNRDFSPWLDEKNLLPGQEWAVEIKREIEKSDFCIILLSNKSVNKRGFFHKEICKALDVLETIPENCIYIIPLRLDDCKVPEKIKKYQWVDLFSDWNSGIEKTVQAIYSQISPEKDQEKYKQKRCFEYIKTAYSDWLVFEKKDQHLIKPEKIHLIYECLFNYKFSIEILEFLLLCISFQKEFDITIINNWISKYGMASIIDVFNRIINQQHSYIRRGVIQLITQLGITDLVILLKKTIENEKDIDNKREILQCLKKYDMRLPNELEQNLLINEKDWVVQSYLLSNFPGIPKCLIISDGTEFSTDLAVLAENALFEIVLKPPSISRLDKKIDLLNIFDLIILVRGEHFRQNTHDVFYDTLFNYVNEGGFLFATSWVSWENVYNQNFNKILPFSHVGSEFVEKKEITIVATEDIHAKNFLEEKITYVSSFERLKNDKESVLLFETEKQLPIFGYRYFGKGICFYYNTCQHYCLGDMQSPFQVNFKLLNCFTKVFQWIYSTKLDRKL